MRDNVLWRKESRIVLALAAALSIDAERALDVYYSTQTARQLSDPKYGLQLTLHAPYPMVPIYISFHTKGSNR